MPLWIAALTMTATWVDGGYLLGTTEGAYKSSLQLGIQGGLCFGLSLMLGGLIFAGIMRRFGFTTLIDPFESPASYSGAPNCWWPSGRPSACCSA
jgi:high affinity choline transporter 7